VGPLWRRWFPSPYRCGYGCFNRLATTNPRRSWADARAVKQDLGVLGMHDRIVFWAFAVWCTMHSMAFAAQPNVFFIVCDDLNRHVGPSGYAHLATPTLDRLAAESVNFTRAYVQYPVCGPSRASFLSGLYPQSTGVLNNKVHLRDTRPGTVTMPVAFRRAGYWTGAVGKVFHKAGDNPEGTAWDAVEKFENDELPLVTESRRDFEAKHGPVTKGKHRQAWRQRLPQLGTQTRGQQQPGYGPSGLTDAQHKDGKNARRVASWLKGRAHGDKPFFIACGIQKPHVPYLAPQSYFDKIPRPSIRYTPDPADDWEDMPAVAGVKRYRQFGFELGVENDALRREYTQAYHACIAFIDTQIAIVLDALRESGHWDDTIVVFTSDHGYHLGEHFMWGKVTLFEECARVPLLVRVPGMTPDVLARLGDSVFFFVALVFAFRRRSRSLSISFLICSHSSRSGCMMTGSTTTRMSSREV